MFHLRRKPIFNRDSKIVIYAIALDWLAWGLIDPFFSAFAHTLMNSLILVGLIPTTKGFFGVISLGPISETIRRVSARKVAIFARIITICCFFCYISGAFFEVIWLLFLGAALNGIGNSARDCSTRDILMEASNKKTASTILGTSYSAKNLLWILSSIVIGFILFFLGGLFQQEPLEVFKYILIAVIPIFIVSMMLVRSLPKHNERMQVNILSPVHMAKYEFRLIKSFFALNALTKFSMMLICFLQIITISLMIFLPLLALDKLGLSHQYVGLLMAAMFCPLLFSAFISIFEDRGDRMNFIIGGLFFATFPLIILSQVNTPLIVGASAVLISLSLAIITPANLGAIAAATEAKDAPLIASLQVLFARLGTLIGASSIGVISEFYGIQTAFLIIAILAVLFALCAVVIKWYFNEQKKVEKHHFKIHPLHPHSFHFHHH